MCAYLFTFYNHAYHGGAHRFRRWFLLRGGCQCLHPEQLLYSPARDGGATVRQHSAHAGGFAGAADGIDTDRWHNELGANDGANDKYDTTAANNGIAAANDNDSTAVHQSFITGNAAYGGTTTTTTTIATSATIATTATATTAAAATATTNSDDGPSGLHNPLEICINIIGYKIR